MDITIDEKISTNKLMIALHDKKDFESLKKPALSDNQRRNVAHAMETVID